MSLDFTFFTLQNIADYLVSGLYFSVMLTAIASTGGLILGIFIALTRLYASRPLRAIATIYVDGMRSIPLVMVILWFFLLVPSSFYNVLPGTLGQNYRSEISAIVTFTIFEAAYFSEIIRAGIQSLSRGQTSASQALGMTRSQGLMYIILPQACRNMLPILLTQVVVLFQDTSLVYAIGSYDLLKGFDVIGKGFGRPVEAYLLAAAVYFTICFSLSFVVKQLNRNIALAR